MKAITRRFPALYQNSSNLNNSRLALQSMMPKFRVLRFDSLIDIFVSIEKRFFVEKYELTFITDDDKFLNDLLSDLLH